MKKYITSIAYFTPTQNLYKCPKNLGIFTGEDNDEKIRTLITAIIW